MKIFGGALARCWLEKSDKYKMDGGTIVLEGTSNSFKMNLDVSSMLKMFSRTPIS